MKSGKVYLFLFTLFSFLWLSCEPEEPEGPTNGIVDFAPKEGTSGTIVTIEMKEAVEEGVLHVYFFGEETVIRSKDKNKIEVAVPSGVTGKSGKISVRTDEGLFYSNSSFVVPGFSISDFSPKYAAWGDTIKITGKNFGFSTTAVMVSGRTPIGVNDTVIYARVDLGPEIGSKSVLEVRIGYKSKAFADSLVKTGKFTFSADTVIPGGEIILKMYPGVVSDETKFLLNRKDSLLLNWTWPIENQWEEVGISLPEDIELGAAELGIYEGSVPFVNKSNKKVHVLLANFTFMPTEATVGGKVKIRMKRVRFFNHQFVIRNIATSENYTLEYGGRVKTDEYEDSSQFPREDESDFYCLIPSSVPAGTYEFFIYTPEKKHKLETKNKLIIK